MLSSFYGLITDIRNWLYDKQRFKTTTFDLFTISVGNLSVGGTGKTPHIEYLIRKLLLTSTIATLSRGYGRKTKGVLIADKATLVNEIGDEPMQFYQKFGDKITVAVAEKRILGVPNIKTQYPETNLLLLDDAFQHRAIGRHLNILLTEFENPFYKDKPLPFGRLRENRKGAIRADIVIVTKCPIDLDTENQAQIEANLSIYTKQQTPVYFTAIQYGSITGFDGEPKEIDKGPICLITGIANPDPILNYVKSIFVEVEHIKYRDHYNFTEKDKEKILTYTKKYRILTTEKDFVRLKPMFTTNELATLPLYFLPIEIEFLQTTKMSFDRLIEEAIKKHRKFDNSSSQNEIV